MSPSRCATAMTIGRSIGVRPTRSAAARPLAGIEIAVMIAPFSSPGVVENLIEGVFGGRTGPGEGHASPEREQAGEQFALRVGGTDGPSDGCHVADRARALTPREVAQQRWGEGGIDEVLKMQVVAPIRTASPSISMPARSSAWRSTAVEGARSGAALTDVPPASTAASGRATRAIASSSVSGRWYCMIICVSPSWARLSTLLKDAEAE